MKKVYCYETDTVYDSVSSASKILKISKGNISSVCNRKLQQTNNYHFKYVDNTDVDNITDELTALKNENEQLKQQIAKLKAEIAELKSSNADNENVELIDRSEEIEDITSKFKSIFADMSDADDYITSTFTPQPKPQKPPKQKPEPPKQEIKLPVFDNDKYNNEIQSCNDISRLKEIVNVCNNVLNECKSIRENNEHEKLFDLKMFEYDVTESKQNAIKRIEFVENPPAPPEKKEFHWNDAEIATNEMFLKEIVRFDEMMCKNAIESHQNKLNEYKNLLQTDTLNESEYKARIEFEEEYISKVKEQQQKLIKERIEFNESYENDKFNYFEFLKLKNNAEKMIDKINQTNVCSTNVDTLKASIELHEKKINHDLRELNDSITQEGIIYNRYAIAIRSHFVKIAQAKLIAYKNNEAYIEELDEQEQSDINTFEKLMKNISLCDADKLKSIKRKIFDKVNSYELYKEDMYVSKMCVAYHKVVAELQSQF